MQKVIIVDDEAPARSLIRGYLNDYPELVILEECNNGVDAVNAINNFKPSIVFLDIQMPGLNGFEVLTHLEELPHIIFSTAYDQYALQAFEVHALDYLLKPYTKKRFAQAIKRTKNVSTDYLSQLQNLAESLNTSNTYPENILVSSKNKLVAVQVADIIRIEAEGDYSKLVTASGNFLSNYGISQMEQKLNPQLFIRVHRSAIININCVKEVFKHPASYDIVMNNKDVVRVSRSYLDNIKKLTF